MVVFSRVLLAMLAVMVIDSPLFAQTAGPNYQGIGAGVGMGLSAVGIGIGLGLIGFAALSGIARQPEQAGQIKGTMFILAGLVEGAGIVGMILCLLIGAKLLGG